MRALIQLERPKSDRDTQRCKSNNTTKVGDILCSFNKAKKIELKQCEGKQFQFNNSTF